MTTTPIRPTPSPSSAAPEHVAPLAWGRHYAMVEPRHFRIEYVINPFMDPARQPEPDRTLEQWHRLVATLRGLGARVDVLPQRSDSPDMVYAMNLGLGLVDRGRADGEARLLLSHMRYAERRHETDSARAWFGAAGWHCDELGRDGVGPHLEAGDAFAFGDALVVGHGPRTELRALEPLARALDVRVRGLRITHPGMYHLDLAFCPLDERRALVCPSALDDASARALLDLVPEPLVLTEEEALTTFCANSVVVPAARPGGRATVVMPACPDRVRVRLEEWGFDVVLVDVSELHLGGGSIRCLTNPLDVTLGRDLPRVPGGEVVLA